MRKIRINLYSKEFQPKLVILSLKHMIIMWLINAVVMGLWANVSNDKKKKLVRQQQTMNDEYESVSDELMQTQVIVSSLKLDTELQSQVETARKIAQGKRELGAYLLRDSNKSGHGFAGFMKALATVRNDGIAITSFSIVDGQADIEGVARTAEDVPKWIGQFREYPDLSNLTFGSVKLNYNRDDNYLGFSLESKIKDDKDDKGERK